MDVALVKARARVPTPRASRSDGSHARAPPP